VHYSCCYSCCYSCGGRKEYERRRGGGKRVRNEGGCGRVPHALGLARHGNVLLGGTHHPPSNHQANPNPNPNPSPNPNQARCSCELGFWPNHIEEHCRAARHDTVPLPYACPIDHYLAPIKLASSPFLHRERTFLVRVRLGLG